MIFKITFIIVLAFIIDSIIGDPPTWPHPVKLIGKLIAFLDKKLNHHKRIEGIYMLIIVLIMTGMLSGLILYLSYRLDFFFGLMIESIMVATTISQKGLKDAAIAVYKPLKINDLPAARQQLSQIVGRDTANLSEEEITRATIETVAENTTDGITAPIFWTAIAGGVGAILYRAINTCDSMVGYHNEQYENFGWASAKLDDLVNYLPARLSGILMLYGGSRGRNESNLSLRNLKVEAIKHASPNSAWTEAATALLLDVKLGGSNYYQGVKSQAEKIGQGRKPLEKEDILRSISIMQRTNYLFSFIIILGVFLYGITRTWF